MHWRQDHMENVLTNVTMTFVIIRYVKLQPMKDVNFFYVLIRQKPPVVIDFLLAWIKTFLLICWYLWQMISLSPNLPKLILYAYCLFSVNCKIREQQYRNENFIHKCWSILFDVLLSYLYMVDHDKIVHSNYRWWTCHSQAVPQQILPWLHTHRELVKEL